MIGTFSPSDSTLLLIDHQLGTMKLIKNISLDVRKAKHSYSGQDGEDFKTPRRSHEFAGRESLRALDVGTRAGSAVGVCHPSQTGRYRQRLERSGG